jgi:hypothetical protein
MIGHPHYWQMPEWLVKAAQAFVALGLPRDVRAGGARHLLGRRLSVRRITCLGAHYQVTGSRASDLVNV